ncbi:MAG: hypothetical protein ACXWPM_06500, partial [Bdellovibrionota bacterium]
MGLRAIIPEAFQTHFFEFIAVFILLNPPCVAILPNPSALLEEFCLMNGGITVKEEGWETPKRDTETGRMTNTGGGSSGG